MLEAGDSWWISGKIRGNAGHSGCGEGCGEQQILTSGAATAGPNMPAGRGTEWLEFSLSPPELPGPRRLSYIGIKIPPLPGGPLSVRRIN